MDVHQPLPDPAVDSPHVLVVDDDPILSTVYRRKLENAGFATEGATTAAAAMARVIDHAKPELRLVVLDLGLPDQHGLDLLGQIREMKDTNTLPVIVVTGADGIEDRIKGLAAGANDYLIKPVALDELVARVQVQRQLVDALQARMDEASDSRRRIAIDLSRMVESDDVRAASLVLTRAVHRIRDVSGSAFIMPLDGGHVVETAGDLLCDAGFSLLHENVSLLSAAAGVGESAQVERRRIGLPGEGPVYLLSLEAGGTRAGWLLVSLAPGLAPDVVRAALAAASDTVAMASPLVSPIVDREALHRDRVNHYSDVIDTGAFDTVYQPIIDLITQEVVGFESLTRFHDGVRPDVAFANAGLAGLQTELEIATARAALERADELPPGTYVSVNFSATTLLDTGFLSEITRHDREVVIELTEHESVEDYVRLREALDTVRDRARIAVDDVGAGYAGLHHLRSLRPDIMKLDRSLVQGIDADPVGRAMVTGMAYFANEVGSTLIGEGIEEVPELETLAELGVGFGQGYLLGKPSPAGRDRGSIRELASLATGRGDLAPGVAS